MMEILRDHITPINGRLDPDRTFEGSTKHREVNAIEDARTAFYENETLARKGLREEILRRQNPEGVFFIVALARKNTYGFNEQPTVGVGEIDIERLNHSGLIYTAVENHLFVPVKTNCEFYLTLEPCETASAYVEVEIVKNSEGFRPSIYLGSKDNLIDVITKPAHVSSESFISELSELYGPAANDTSERLWQVTNEIFHLLSF